MITFLPVSDFADSAYYLDRLRLGKQRVEAVQIMEVLLNKPNNSRWKSNPAVEMWRGYEQFLLAYTLAMCKEWTKRGYIDNQAKRVVQMVNKHVDRATVGKPPKPWWLGYEEFHLSHQSNLVRKMPERYGEFFPDVSSSLPYYWPKSERPT